MMCRESPVQQSHDPSVTLVPFLERSTLIVTGLPLLPLSGSTFLCHLRGTAYCHLRSVPVPVPEPECFLGRLYPTKDVYFLKDPTDEE